MLLLPASSLAGTLTSLYVVQDPVAGKLRKPSTTAPLTLTDMGRSAPCATAYPNTM